MILRFVIYMVWGFGIPMLLMVISIIHDSVEKNRMALRLADDSQEAKVGSVTFNLRPGFAEESCWFTKVSALKDVWINSGSKHSISCA